MALLERVSTLIRANINDLVDKAEDPEKMIKQVILDMQNQLLQVKTQVAIAIADQHLLEKKQKENQDKTAEWKRKAELAVSKKQDDLARAALERSLSCKQNGENFAQQVADQGRILAPLLRPRAVGDARRLHDRRVVAHVVHQADEAVVEHADRDAEDRLDLRDARAGQRRDRLIEL